MDILWKGVVGGLVTALIVWASKRGNVLPGILPLAPTFAVIAQGNSTGFREACLAGFRTIPAYLAFLGACWLFIERVDYRLAVLGGIAVWLAAALAIFLAPRYL
ncbi:GlpM family protein [Mesorhizobium sp.]|uniref:GlpM family protein n=1 Tax=Mesorhizobium sp. TaxID=1871066 RepID=UPI000FE71444|nr:GlpM family protein [Mesorhizobium sp.]RWC18345.1 MAG: hypothetical protein EOS53_17285 [Mesorhizobium sp.]